MALADLGGVWPVMTRHGGDHRGRRYRDGAAVRFLFSQAATRGDWLADAIRIGPKPAPATSCIAMGKHGARELNYSSDIDLIVFYEPELRAPASRGSSRSPSSCA